MLASLPPFYNTTCSSYNNLSFYNYYKLAKLYYLSQPLYTPTISFTIIRSNFIVLIKVPNSPTTILVRTNPLSLLL